MPGPHVDDKKGKKAMVYKARKDIRNRGPRKKEKEKENQISRACPKKIYCYIPCSYLESFYTKIQYFGPRSD